MFDPPASRRLRVLAFDPSLATRLETASLNQITLKIPWEELERGPIGEYIEVVDYDPASGVFYQPVDLDHPHLLAQDGLAPSESNPQFHQQMTYAVAMTTIRQFERALGRVTFWSDRRSRLATGRYCQQFVRRLRIYPHALRDRNAYYSPAKKALLFGYFPANGDHNGDSLSTPGTVIFTCLSHDIIVHEVTHALLDGVHPRFNEPTNPDVHAFHEAFSDIVALFQHFSFPAVLENQISQTRGNFHTENLLSQLAQQFGRATGRGTALRDAIGGINPKTGLWEARQPNPSALKNNYGAHSRGSILVAAVFRTFLMIYRARTADLFRLATGGTGTLPSGEIHPDLTKRLAIEAAQCADRILQMCIRAIDYCPPVDVTFGDFLRGIITGDLDYAPEDEDGYRIVFIQCFREWGIHPHGVTSLGADALIWPSGDELMEELTAHGEPTVDKATLHQHLKQDFLTLAQAWNLENDRYEIWKSASFIRQLFWQWLHGSDGYGRHYAKSFGLILDSSEAPPTVYRNTDGNPAVEIHSVRPAVRRTIAGRARTDFVVEITQRRRGYFDSEEQKVKDQPGNFVPREEDGDFKYRAGCTILIDPATQEVRRVIRTTGTVADNVGLERVRQYLCGDASVPHGVNSFDAGLSTSLKGTYEQMRDEPFALIHRVEEI